MSRLHEPSVLSRRTVQQLTAYGIPQEQICKILGCCEDTLRAHYRDEIDTGLARANAQVAQNLFNIAMGTGKESVTAAIFWLKCRARWKDTTVHEHVGKDGEELAVRHRLVADLTRLLE